MKTDPAGETAAQRRRKTERRKELALRTGLLLLAALLAFSFSDPGRAFWRSAFAVSGFSSSPELEKAPLRIHVLDVGKADAVLLECEGHAALLDAGTGLAGDIVVDYLARQGIDSLEYAIMSHPDKDHIGGMAQVLREIPVTAFVQAELPESLLPDSGEYAALEQALSAGAYERITAAAGTSFALGEARCSVLGPLQEYGDTNNHSLVLKLTYRGFTALFCGDIEQEAERDLVASEQELSADLLKVPHHGSKTSSTKRFLREVAPQYAVISVGPDKNELPREETLLRLEQTGAEIYRTDTDGTVVFSYDGETISIETEK